MSEQQMHSTVRDGSAVPGGPGGRGGPGGTGLGGPQAAWTGWVRFGGVLMTVVGVFAVIEGFLALFLPATYVTTNGAVLALTFVGWGWLHIILGVLVAAVGLSLLRDEAPGWARGTAIVLVALNTIVQLAWLPAYPIWSILMIALDVLIIGALVATGDRAARSG